MIKWHIYTKDERIVTVEADDWYLDRKFLHFVIGKRTKVASFKLDSITAWIQISKLERDENGKIK